MRNAIENFNKQFAYNPSIENRQNLKALSKFVISGMGGSHLAADLIKIWKPEIDIIIHKDYGLPPLSKEDLASRLFIASSYSGNTEEVIDSLSAALKKDMQVCIIAVGGKLIEIAKQNSLPYIQMPDTNIQPRSALGFSMRAILKAISEEGALSESSSLSASLNPKNFEAKGQNLAKVFNGFVPIVYASNRNEGIAYNWKIKLNETGKVPAFYNVIPELNHNEMNSFDVKDTSRLLSQRFRFIFIDDPEDHPLVQKRMYNLKKLYEERGFWVEIVPLEGENIFQRIFSCLILADWTAYYTALSYGLEPEQVPMIEEFKKLITKD